MEKTGDLWLRLSPPLLNLRAIIDSTSPENYRYKDRCVSSVIFFFILHIRLFPVCPFAFYSPVCDKRRSDSSHLKVREDLLPSHVRQQNKYKDAGPDIPQPPGGQIRKDRVYSNCICFSVCLTDIPSLLLPHAIALPRKMPSSAIRYRPMTTFVDGQHANDMTSKQGPIYTDPDQLIPRSWRKPRGSGFSLPSSAADLAELWGKLADKPKENAKRIFRLRASVPTTPRQPENTMSLDVAMPGRSRAHSEIFVGGDEERVAQYIASQMLESNSSSNSVYGGASPRPMSRDRSNSDDSNIMSGNMPTLRNERVVATGNGITVSVALAEPVLFLPGYDHNDPSTKKSAILRGHLHIKTTKSVKIKKVSICFRGQAQTDWPDGKCYFKDLIVSLSRQALINVHRHSTQEGQFS